MSIHYGFNVRTETTPGMHVEIKFEGRNTQMKENHLKRLLSFVLVIAMVLSLCPTIAFAGDTLPYRGESALGDNEPTSHGYRAEDLLSWDPATDPDAELLRAGSSAEPH